ncbi:MAG: FecR domain-containing protein [Agriterribacter sp.]
MQERIQYLFKKFLNNTCSKEEFEEVFLFIKMAESDNEIRTLLDTTLEIFEKERNDAEKANVFVSGNGEIEPLLHNHSLPAGQHKRKRQHLIWYSTAACCAIIVMLMLWNKNSGYPENLPVEIAGSSIKQATEKSQYRHLVLPDSTEVWLNAASELEFPEKFGSNKREVLLTGEAFFDVKHADKIPFIIYTGKVSTVVLGTAFNIKAYPDMNKITVSVKRGRVQVKYVDKPVAMLGVGEQVSIAVNDSTIKEKKLDEVEVSAWQQGKLVYDDYTVEDIIKDLERVFNSNIQIKNNVVKELRVSTSFDAAMGLEKALEILCRLTDTKLSKENNIYYIK